MRVIITTVRDYVAVGRSVYNGLRRPRAAVPKILEAMKGKDPALWDLYASKHTPAKPPLEREAELALLIGMIRAALHKNHKRIARTLFSELRLRAIEYGYAWERY